MLKVSCFQLVMVTTDKVKAKHAAPAWPRIENDEFYMAVGSSRPREDSWRIGQLELVRWFQELYGLHPLDSDQLLSQMTKAPIANVVDANFSGVIETAKGLTLN
jgi:hypothetical protein